MRKEKIRAVYQIKNKVTGETLTLAALSTRFQYYGIPHPTLEAKKYLISLTD